MKTIGRYQEGIRDGFVDSIIISLPHNTGGHTYTEYTRIADKYKTCIYTVTPSPYQEGYGIGLDLGAIYLSITG